MDKLKDLLHVLAWIVTMGGMFSLCVYRALPANGWADYERGQYVAIAPLFGMMLLFSLFALAGLFIKWYEEGR